MEKLYYSIGEVAKELNENTSLIRYWANSFPKYIKPYRNAKGNRLFTREDIDTLKQIHYLVKSKGLTLDGAERQLQLDRSTVDRSARTLESLKRIRKQLVEVKNLL